MAERSIVHGSFAVERSYTVPPARVFRAWADRAVKEKWFGPSEVFEFREGGREFATGPTPDGTQVFTYDVRYADIVEGAGGQVSFVELAAPLEERLVRNVTEFRLDQKRSKRDLDFSRQNLFDAEARWRMNTGSEPTVGERLLEGRAHLRVDNTDLPPAVVAKLVVEAWGLSRG